MWTLVGSGIKHVNDTTKLMSDVLPNECVHYQQRVTEFDPEASQVKLASGEVVKIFFIDKFVV